MTITDHGMRLSVWQPQRRAVPFGATTSLSVSVLADADAIPTFGTWALHEALSTTPEGERLPTAHELKMRLLLAQIADIPISLPELADKTARAKDLT